MNDKLKFGFIGLIIGALAVFGINTFFFSSKTIIENRSKQIGMDAIDAHFIEQMIPHHEDAITMSNLALTKAKKPEIKQLSQNIINSQSEEITLMKEWYKNWFDRELPTGQDVMKTHGMMSDKSSMHMGIRGDESDTEKLEKALDFDTAYIEHMIPHHQMAVMMASMLKNGTKRPEMINLADDIISAQTKEIEQMREWLKNW